MINCDDKFIIYFNLSLLVIKLGIGRELVPELNLLKCNEFKIQFIIFDDKSLYKAIKHFFFQNQVSGSNMILYQFFPIQLSPFSLRYSKEMSEYEH